MGEDFELMDPQNENTYKKLRLSEYETPTP
jgi:hypothetical protein